MLVLSLLLSAVNSYAKTSNNAVNEAFPTAVISKGPFDSGLESQYMNPDSGTTFSPAPRSFSDKKPQLSAVIFFTILLYMGFVYFYETILFTFYPSNDITAEQEWRVSL
jgi:hypothetical protein